MSWPADHAVAFEAGLRSPSPQVPVALCARIFLSLPLPGVVQVTTGVGSPLAMQEISALFPSLTSSLGVTALMVAGMMT